MAYADLFDAINYIYDGNVKVKELRWKSFVETAVMLELTINAGDLNAVDSKATVNDTVLGGLNDSESGTVIGKHPV